MVQFSVYAKFCAGEEKTKTVLKRVKAALPDQGKVDILFFTDKQYENIVRYEKGTSRLVEGKPKQFLLI